MSERLSPSQLARDLGVSRQAIYNLQERGILPRDPDGKLDRAEATAAIASNVHPAGKAATAAAPSAPDTPPPAGDNKPPVIDYHTAKTLRELTEAQIAQIKLREMQSKLVPIDVLERQLRAAHIAARESLRAEAAPLAAEVAALAGIQAEQIEPLLQQRFDALLIRLANWQSAEAEDDPDEEDEDEDA